MPGARGNPRCWQMARYFVSCGHQVTFVTSLSGTAENRNITAKKKYSEKKQFIEEFHIDGLHIIAINIQGGHMLSFPRRVLSWLRFYRSAWIAARDLENFDIIIGYTAPLTMAALARKLSKHWKIPYCMEVADVWPDVPIGMGYIRSKMLIRVLYWRTNLLYKDAVRIFPYTEGMREQILGHGDHKRKIHVLHNGVSCESTRFHNRPKTKSCVKVLYAGTIGKSYDLTQLVRVIKIIEDSGRLDLEFMVVGTGNDEDRVKGLAKSLKIKTLQFLPPVGHEKVPELLKQADIGISCVAPYPVLEANGATKFFDYLASGLPLVVNHLGWQSEYLKQNFCGLSSEQGDEIGFAKNILKLADSYELRKEFAKNGRVLAENIFDRKKIAKKYLEYLLESSSRG